MVGNFAYTYQMQNKSHRMDHISVLPTSFDTFASDAWQRHLVNAVTELLYRLLDKQTML